MCAPRCASGLQYAPGHGERGQKHQGWPLLKGGMINLCPLHNRLLPSATRPFNNFSLSVMSRQAQTTAATCPALLAARALLRFGDFRNQLPSNERDAVSFAVCYTCLQYLGLCSSASALLGFSVANCALSLFGFCSAKGAAEVFGPAAWGAGYVPEGHRQLTAGSISVLCLFWGHRLVPQRPGDRCTSAVESQCEGQQKRGPKPLPLY